MSSTGLLKQYALSYFWSTPNQDRQFILKPARLSQETGVSFSITVRNQEVMLPDSIVSAADRLGQQFGDRKRLYAVFDLSLALPLSTNLPFQRDTWFRVSELMNTRNLDIMFYTRTGKRIPSGLGYLRRHTDGGYLLAIEMNRNLTWNFFDEVNTLYVRFYSNAFFFTTRFTLDSNYDSETGIDYRYGMQSSTGLLAHDITRAQFITWLGPRIVRSQDATLNAYGRVSVFSNGYLCPDVTAANGTPANTFVEAVYDRAVFAEKRLLLRDLPAFHSDLDNKDKYIVMPWAEDEPSTIQFYDDVDMYLCRNGKGVYVHRNALNPVSAWTENPADAIRQLTNNSFAISKDYIEAFIVDNPWLDDTGDSANPAYLLVKLKHSGYNRPLVNEKYRLQELNKLGPNGVITAMNGSQSTEPDWRATSIEQSDYNRAMAKLYASDVTDQLAYSALGYVGATALIMPTDLNGSNTVTQTISNVYFEVPNQYKDVSLLVFDQPGYLMRVISGTGGRSLASAPVAGDAATYQQHAKVIQGKLDLDATQTSFYGMDIVSNGSSVNDQGFACYVCTKDENGKPLNDWEYVPPGSNLWQVSEDGLSVEWNTQALAQSNAYTAVRFNNRVVYTKQVTFPAVADGILTFDVSHTCQVEGSPAYQVEYIPYGTFLVFYQENGKWILLVEGIDYYLTWPRIVVVKKFTGKLIRTVAYGLCNADMGQDTVQETGFSFRGVLSANDVWNVRDNTNTIIANHGRVIPSDQVVAFENYWRLMDQPYTQDQNVYPYAVIDVVQPMERVFGSDYNTLEGRAASLADMRGIQQYLSMHMDFQPPDMQNVSKIQYVLYSPFISRVINEMLTGTFPTVPPVDSLSTGQIQQLTSAYNWLIDFDPIRKNYDKENCILVPHCFDTPVALTLNQYMLVKRMINIYFNNQINLSTFITVA